MTPELLDRLRPHAEVIHASPGEVIVWEGAEQTAIYLVIRGSLTVTLRVRGEMESVLGEIGPGGIFGELALIDEGPAAATVVADTTATLWRLESTAPVFTDKALVWALLQGLCAKVRSANHRLGEAVAWGLAATATTSAPG